MPIYYVLYCFSVSIRQGAAYIVFAYAGIIDDYYKDIVVYKMTLNKTRLYVHRLINSCLINTKSLQPKNNAIICFFNI